MQPESSRSNNGEPSVSEPAGASQVVINPRIPRAALVPLIVGVLGVAGVGLAMIARTLYSLHSEAASLKRQMRAFAEDSRRVSASRQEGTDTAKTAGTGGRMRRGKGPRLSGLEWGGEGSGGRRYMEVLSDGSEPGPGRDASLFAAITGAYRTGHCRTGARILRTCHDRMVTYSNDSRVTLLHVMAQIHPGVVRSLVTAGAKLHANDKDGFTPLHWAAAEGRLDVVEFLLQQGADPMARNPQGISPLHMAAGMEEKEWAVADHRKRITSRAWGRGKPNSVVLVTKLLIENGADAASPAANGITPLHVAAEKGRSEVAKVLLRYGASTSAKDKRGFTPFELAELHGHKVIAELLSTGQDPVVEP